MNIGTTTLKPRMTHEEMHAVLDSLGLKKRYFPYQEPELEEILLTTRKGWQIVDGLLVGSQIDLYNDLCFRVWTPQVQKSNRIAKERNLRIRVLTSECELFIPIAMADELLPLFGAKVKRPCSERQLAQLAKMRSLL